MDECRQQEAALLELLGDLSAAAGIPRPSTQVPELALQVLGEAVQEVAIAGPLRGEGPHVPSVVLAARAVESYRGLREYLACARERLDELRPQLRENEGLAERLACWEDSWERFAFYTENPHLMEGVHALASFLARALRAAPSLQQMLEDRDAELFLVLPRLVCLCLLSGLERPVAQLLRPLLPCHFADSSAQPGGDQAPAPSAQFEGVLELLGGSAEHGAWEALLRRAVAGAGAAAAAGACPEAGPGRREAAAGAVEGLMREVEGWSMELQRHHPVAWNDLASVLVQCLVWGPGDVEAACPTRFVL
ncbi:unnamed protein product [Prorocentrum cordatum]|uniref:Uncharacterized protein n=1 Tax=Prorocentrum cordatum TaxID=2364126 RepID=A0ABN9X5K2_9DINO|nr:unnamed protein product [Polarella glacialis]